MMTIGKVFKTVVGSTLLVGAGLGLFKAGQFWGAHEQRERDDAAMDTILTKAADQKCGADAARSFLRQKIAQADHALKTQGFFRASDPASPHYALRYAKDKKPVVLKDVSGRPFEALLAEPRENGFALYGRFRENGTSVVRRAELGGANAGRLFGCAIQAYEDVEKASYIMEALRDRTVSDMTTYVRKEMRAARRCVP